MNTLDDKVRWFNSDFNKAMSEMNVEMARQNAIKVLEMSYKENIITPDEYRENLKRLCKLYFKD